MTAPASLDRRAQFAVLLAGALVMCAAAPRAQADHHQWRGPDNVTGNYDRFVTGSYPSAPVPNPTFIGAGIDLTGIGWATADPRAASPW